MPRARNIQVDPILGMLRWNGKATPTKLANVLGCSYGTAVNRLHHENSLSIAELQKIHRSGISKEQIMEALSQKFNY